jgi:XRE family transcriptional regulator, regulator of sulfur utilization
MSKLSKSIGERIRNERKEQGLSQEKLAELAKLNTSYIASVERGRYSIGIDNLRKICKALRIKMVDLFNGY